MDKKTKANKGKKTVKQQQQKFGFSVNLDEEEPDIPAEKVPSKQEQQFKVVYSKQFKHQRPQDKPAEVELQTKSEQVQVPTAKQTHQKQIQAVNTCDNKEQQIESIIQNQNYQAFASQSERIKQQIIEAPIPYQNIIQKREREEEKKQQKIFEAQVIQIRKPEVLDQKKTVIVQKETDKQHSKAQTFKMESEQILDQEIDQLPIIETKFVKKQATKTAPKKKDTKGKPKKSTKPILSIDFEQFQQKLELVEEKNSPKLQETQQVPYKTQANTQIIQKQQDSPPAKNQPLVQQIKEAQTSLVKQKDYVKQQLQQEINKTPNIQARHQEVQQVVQQVIQKPISVYNQSIPTINKTSSIIQTQIKLDDEEIQPKIEITAKINKKVRKFKANKKQNKNQIKISLDTEAFLIEDVKQQINQQQIQQIERSVNTENAEIQQKKQHNIEKQQQISSPDKIQEKTVYSEDKLKQKVQEKDIQNTEIITQVANQILNNQQRQPVISDNFKQVYIQKEANNQQQLIPQKVVAVQPVELQLDLEFKVSKVKNVKKGAKKDTRNKNVKVQKQLTMQLQLDDFQIEDIKAKENPTIPEIIESKKEQELPIIQTKTNVHKQNILAENQQQNIKEKFIEQIKEGEQKRPNEYVQEEQKESPKQKHYQTQKNYNQSLQQLNRQQSKNNQEQTQKIRQNLPQIQEQYINSPQPAAQIKKQIIEETLILDQPIIKQKGKAQVKKPAKKPKAKPKAKTNQLNLFQSVLEQQKPIEPINVNVPIRQEVYHSPQKEERDIQVQTKIQEQAIPIKQSDKAENKPTQKQRQIELTEQQLQRKKQLAFYKKLQEENQLQLRLMEQSAFTQQNIQPLQKSSRQANEIVNNIEEQKTEPPKIQNAMVQTKQLQKMKQVEKQAVINLQEQQFSTKIVLSQVNKQKSKTNKKITKKATKPKQKVTSIISADMMDIALQEQPIKVIVQQKVDKNFNERQPSSKQAIQVAQSRKSDQQTVNKQHSPTIHSPKTLQHQLYLSESSHNIRQEKKDSPLKQKPILSPIKKTDSFNNKSESIVAELIDLIRFKGDQDIRLARERLNMLQQDVRSRLLRKGPKPLKLQTRSSQSAEIYGNIIDENISLREQLRNMGRG